MQQLLMIGALVALVSSGCPQNSASTSSAPPTTPTSNSTEATMPEQPAEAPATDTEETATNVTEEEKVVRTEREWRRILSREQYHVLRQKGTERPFVNKYDHHFEPGSYACAACGQVLFESDTKFNSGCGWPAFYAAKAGDLVTLTPDYSLGMIRTEVTCTRCESHLGHIFDDAPQTPTGQRYCINSVSLKFIPADAEKEQAKKPDQAEK